MATHAEHAEHTEHGEHTHHVVNPIVYFMVFGALMIFLFLTVAASYVDLHQYVPIPGLNIIVMLLIDVIKAALVVLYFMHVKDGTRLVWLWAATGFVWFLILFVTIMDYVTRNWGTSALGGAAGWE
jgi:cytochrome c oxidase subunit IV